MFIEAIKNVTKFTKPITFVSRLFPKTLINGSATLFFVNEDGDAITCRHVADVILDGHNRNIKYEQYKAEKEQLDVKGQKKHLLGIDKKYEYKNDIMIQQIFNLPFFETDGSDLKIDVIPHKTLDLALVRCSNYKKAHYTSYATFVKDFEKIQQGQLLCRLGFPFPEFTNFRYNENTDSIEWSNEGQSHTASFPIEGMITRFYGDNTNGIVSITGIEISTPGLRGQSGGPLFDKDGLIYGMQSSTVHHYLDFSNTKTVMKNGRKTTVSSHDFLNVGSCVHVEPIKEFLKELKVKFYEE